MIPKDVYLKAAESIDKAHGYSCHAVEDATPNWEDGQHARDLYGEMLSPSGCPCLDEEGWWSRCPAPRRRADQTARVFALLLADQMVKTGDIQLN